MTYPAYNSILFATYELYKRLAGVNMDNLNYFQLSGHAIIGGGFSAILTSIVACPTELIKCNLQMQND